MTVAQGDLTMDPDNPAAGGVGRGAVIYKVAGVDKTRVTAAAFKIHGFYKEHDSLEYFLLGSVLVRASARNGPWQAGRVHADGIHWEERIWVEGEFIAFRDHVANLVGVRLSPREELEQGIANCPIIIRNFQRLQARYAPESEEYADFEGLIAAGRREMASLKEELKALQSASPEMASAAR